MSDLEQEVSRLHCGTYGRGGKPQRQFNKSDIVVLHENVLGCGGGRNHIWKGHNINIMLYIMLYNVSWTSCCTKLSPEIDPNLGRVILGSLGDVK